MDRRPRPLRDACGVASFFTWSYVVVFALLCAAASLLLAALGATFWDRDRRVFQAIARLWGGGLARTLPFAVEVRGAEHARGGPFVVTPTHSSVIDLLVLFLLPRPFRIVVKRSWLYTPYGSNIWLAGYVPTHRTGDPGSAAATLARCRGWLERGVDIVIFPEGTRSRDWRLLRFRRGPFDLAVASGCAVLPVAVAGTNDIAHPESLRFSFRGEVIVEILPPISPNGLSARELRDACRAALEARMDALRLELRRRTGQGPAEAPPAEPPTL